MQGSLMGLQIQSHDSGFVEISYISASLFMYCIMTLACEIPDMLVKAYKGVQISWHTKL